MRLHSALCLLVIAIHALGPAALMAWPNDPEVNAPVCTDPHVQLAPRSASDGAGGVFQVWADQRGVDTDIYLQRLTGLGAIAPGWPVDGLAICTAAGHQEAPVVAADGSGGAVVAWEDARSSIDGDIYGVRIDANGNLVAGWSADGSALCVAAGGQGDLEILTSAGGGAILTWWDVRSDTGDVYALRVTGSGVPASGWASDGVLLCAAAGMQSEPEIAADGSGGAIVAWTDERNGNPDIYAMRVSSAGAPAAFWPLDGAPVCTATGAQSNPDIVTDGDHGALVVWTDARNLETDIYARRLTRTGGIAAGWDPDGEPLCTAFWYQTDPRAVSDGAGGLIAAWQDYRGEFRDIYAQRIDGFGVIPAGWAADGEPLTTASLEQLSPEIVSDGAGGAIVGWEDHRSGFTIDVYAQRITEAGDIAWTPDGVAISIASGHQGQATIASDGAGGAFFCWLDTRNGPPDDLYAQGVQADGVLGRVLDVPPVPRETARLAFVSPSPASNPTRIRFALPRSAPFTIAVFDAGGRRVRELLAGTSEAGDHVTGWDLRDQAGTRVPDGIYWVRLVVDGRASSRRVVVVD